MTSPVRADGYVPVDPDLNLVHDNGPDLDHTKCGIYLTWVKSITLIPITYDWCPECYPPEPDLGADAEAGMSREWKDHT